MTISQRVFDLLNKQGRKQNELSEFSGISTSTISAWNKRGTNPSADVISTLADFFNVSTDYLLTGKEKSSPTIELTADEQELLDLYSDLSIENKARVRERAAVLAELEAPVADEPELEEPDTIFIEYSVCSVSAGSGEPLINDSYPDFIEVKRNEVTEDANFAVKINGNSMHPHFKDNDIILVRSQPEVEVGEIGVFTIDGDGYIKERGEDRLISLNPEYDDVYFEEGQDIRCKGLVIATLEAEDFV